METIFADKMINIKKLTVLLPAYNEEDQIEKTIESVNEVLVSCIKDFTILVVDDGSRDRTGIIADGLVGRLKNVNVIHHDKNYGFGQALRTGFENADSELILINPIDNILYKDEIEKYIEKSHDFDIVAGFRTKKTDYSLFRRIGSESYRLMIRWIFFILIVLPWLVRAQI